MTSKIVVNNIEADAGVSTVFFNSDIGATDGTLNVDGNLTVDGVITYEDVTNVDSVGIVTARSGLHVTSGLVGLGTDNPTKKLQVFDSSATSTTARTNTVARFLSNASNADCNIQLSNGVDHSAQIGIVGNGAEVYIAQDGIERLRINSSGNIGIGTDNPQTALEIGKRHTDPVIRFNDPDDRRMSIRGPSANNIASVGTESNNDLMFFTNGYSNERFRITSTGRQQGHTDYAVVGINTFASWARTGGAIRAEVGYNAETTDYMYFGTGTDHPVALRVNNDTALYIKNDTNRSVGIGTDNPQSKLDVAGEIRASGIAITESYPTIKPSLNLDFANSRSLDSRITFERASGATYVGRDGLIKYAGSGEPRFDHDPITCECLGLMMESSRTNLTNDDWRQSGADRFSLTLNDTGTVAPDGSTDAAKVFITGSESSPSSGIYFFASSTSFTSSSIHTGSVFVKPALENVFRITAHSNYASQTDGGSAQTVNFDYNLSTQTVTLNTGAIAGSITPYQNGWYRLSFTYYRNSSNSNSNYAVILYPQTYSSVNNSPGSGTRNICWVWGAQTEVGGFASSYIDSGTTTAIRSAENTLINGQSFTDFYNQQESTILCNFSQYTSGYNVNTGATGNERAYRIKASTGADTRIDYVTYNQYHPYIAGDGGGIVNLQGFTNLYGGLENRTAVRVKENDFASALNGEIKTTVTSGSWPPSNLMTEVRIGTPDELNGHIKSFVYYPKALPDAQLISLTT